VLHTVSGYSKINLEYLKYSNLKYLLKVLLKEKFVITNVNSNDHFISVYYFI